MIKKLENMGLYLIAMVLALVVIGVRNYKIVIGFTFVISFGIWFTIACLNSLMVYGMIV